LLDIGQLPEGFPTFRLNGLRGVDPDQVGQLREKLSPLKKERDRE